MEGRNLALHALQFDFSLPRYLSLKMAGKRAPSLYWHPAVSCLRYIKGSEPELPGEDWVKIRVTYGGICGSDMNLIFLHDSPSVSPLTSFPFTVGHEVAGRVAETGRDVRDLHAGERVAVNPLLSCAARGFSEPCPACRRGDTGLCVRTTEGTVSPGLLIGACRDTGGSWSTCLVAHRSQVVRLPDHVSDENGVMAEPFSCALHSVLLQPPEPDDEVLVIGAGTIGICVVAAIRALGIPCRITVLTKYAFQSTAALRYGADQTVRASRIHRHLAELADIWNAKLLKPVFGPPVLAGGADLVYECVGSRHSIQDAFGLARRGGKVALLGLAGRLGTIDWTPPG